MTAITERELGTTGLKFTLLGLGGAPLGDYSELIPEDRAAATVEAAWAAGIRYFDTAPLYGQGLSEHRLGRFLRRQPRDSFALSTKVGRLLRRELAGRIDRSGFLGGLNFAAEYDYSYDGAMLSIEHSLARLGLKRIDVALIHDVDVWNYGSAEAYEARFREAMQWRMRALDEARRHGVVRAIGVGVNEVQPCVRFAREGEFDCFLLAGRYTLLEQNGLGDLLPEAERRRFSILIGGPYNWVSWLPAPCRGRILVAAPPRRWSAWRVSRRSADSTGFRSPPPLFNSRLAIPGSRRSYPARLRHEKSRRTRR